MGANQKAYEELKAAKEDEIAAGQAQIDTKTQELASTDEKNAQAKEDIEDTRKSLAADEEFLAMLKEKCQRTDKEWEERSKTRQLEMEAVSKALAVLSSDDAHDLFTKTFNPALLQEQTSDRRTRASELLSAAAKKLQSPRLATLAVRARLDAFTRVKKAIDDMISLQRPLILSRLRLPRCRCSSSALARTVRSRTRSSRPPSPISARPRSSFRLRLPSWPTSTARLRRLPCSSARSQPAHHHQQASRNIKKMQRP